MLKRVDEVVSIESTKIETEPRFGEGFYRDHV